MPELVRIYERNISPSSQMCAALSLGHIGVGARAALPALIRNFTHANSDTRFYAVSAVADIGGQPELVIPVLASALKDTNVNVRWNALSGLSRFRGRARSVVPEIVKMLNDPGIAGGVSITQEVESALWLIAPEKAGKPLAIEQATPMITNGVTSQAVKAMFMGKRQTLISSGRHIPAISQYWNSDPRPWLTLYRGSDGSENADVLLGNFEVLNLPASDNLNISTLCIIADGQILLSARDNHDDKFLEIRRVEGESRPETPPSPPRS